ncbi:hypothetical protein MASR1M31_16480 [Porphyromonadaceae bacterium]
METLFLTVFIYTPIILIVIGFIFEHIGWIKNKYFSKYGAAIIFLFFSLSAGLLCIYDSHTGKIGYLINNSQSVYICTGKTAITYHKTSSCKGLSRCGGIVEKMNVDDAKKKGRRACKICY